MKALKEIFYWTLALVFAGIMLVGAIAEIDVAPWAVAILKPALLAAGFCGCVWASNKTAFGRRITGEDIF